MANQFTAPITDQHRHTVATLIAAGVRPYSILRLAGVTRHAVETIMAEDGWPALLDSKVEAITRLKSGPVSLSHQLPRACDLNHPLAIMVARVLLDGREVPATAFDQDAGWVESHLADLSDQRPDDHGDHRHYGEVEVEWTADAQNWWNEVGGQA